MKIIFTLLLVVFSVSALYPQILKKKIPDKVVVLTFDDAPASHFSYVAPLLQQYGFGGTFFVCEFPPNFSDSSKYMNWRQIQQLDQMGFEVANHTQTHPPVSKLSKQQFINQLKYIENKCDSLGIPTPATFAYPGYDLDPASVETLLENGYKLARIGGNRAYNPKEDHPLLIPSWGMGADNRQLIFDSFKEAKDGKIVVLTIHGVPDIEHPWVTIPPDLFKEYIQYLADNHYTVISLRDLCNYVDTEEALREITPDFGKAQKK